MDSFDMFSFMVGEKMSSNVVGDGAERAAYLALKSEIQEHARQYYSLDAPTISDCEYDQLMSRLKEMERHHPEWVQADSPSQVVGGPIRREAGVAITHNVPMLSIQDVFEYSEVEQWVNEVYSLFPQCDLHVEEKIDGLSMTVRYQAGKLVVAETRGDGYVGEDVTANAFCIAGVPKEIRTTSPDDYLEVRGEVYMTHANFELYNARMQELGKPLAANARNLAAGTLRQLDASIVEQRGLSFFAFNVQDANGAYADLVSSQGYGLNELRALGFTPVKSYVCSSVREVLDAITKIGESRVSLPYDIDGAVVKVGNLHNREKFPTGSKYAAGHIAYKYPPEEKEVIISDIEIGVGRTGKLSFTAVFEQPVQLCGTSVQRATVHNIEHIRKKGIGIGAHAIARKQGDIIPAIVRVCDGYEAVFEAPSACPVCGESLYSEPGAADIYCVNPNCPAQIKNTLVHFCSREAMDIKALGEVIISDLVDRGYLHSYADIYDLRSRRADLVASGIIGRDKNTDKVLAAIEESKSREAYRFLAGIGIRNVGKVTAKVLLQAFGSIGALKEASLEQLVAIPDVGQTTAACIRNYFLNEQNQALLRRVENAGINLVSDKQPISSALAGKVICITGTLSKPRDHFVELIESCGGRASGSVSKKTDFLLAGESAGSKLQKAQSLGVTILNEEQFIKLIN